MQEQLRVGPLNTTEWDALPGQSLAAMLALVGSKKMDVEALRARTRLSPYAFTNLLNWLQREYLVDVIASLDGSAFGEKIELTEAGQSLLVSLLEQTCELPEFH
jgi:hypothetical protein